MIEDIYYSRKNFKRPLLQRSQHKSFEKEVNTLDRFFRDGAAYCMGTMNKDCWYMYTLNPIERYGYIQHTAYSNVGMAENHIICTIIVYLYQNIRVK